MINPDWDRWIRSSVNVYLDAEIRTALGEMKILPEGAPEQDRAGAQDWIEIRMDGPKYQPLGNSEWRVTVEINLLINSLINEGNIYRHRDIAGEIAAILSGTIPVKKYGNDNTISLGCLRIEDIYTHYYDRAGKDTPLKQATIDCFGVIELTGG